MPAVLPGPRGVKTANVGARRLSEAIGFEPVIDYDEAELVRRSASAT